MMGRFWMSNTWRGTSQGSSNFLPNERVMQPLGYCPVCCSDILCCDMLLLFAPSSLLIFFCCKFWLAQCLMLLTILYCMFLSFWCSFFNFSWLSLVRLSRKDRWFIVHILNLFNVFRELLLTLPAYFIAFLLVLSADTWC